jgi:hypothetical protein
MLKSKYRLIIAAIAALMAELVYPALGGVAHAAPQFDFTVVRWDTHKAQTDSGLTICVKPKTNLAVPAGTDVSPYHLVIQFPHLTSGGDFTFNSTTTTNWTLDTAFTAGEGPITWNGTSYSPTAFTSIPGTFAHPDTVTAPVANTTGGIVKIPFGTTAGFNLLASNLYCLHITATNTLHNSDAGTAPTMVEGSVSMFDNAGSPALLYKTFFNTSIIADDTVVVTAIVPPNFSMTLTPNSVDFGRMSTQQINASTTSVLTITTNAAGGWIAWVKDTNRGGSGAEGLRSSTAGYTIKSGPVGAPGTGLLNGTPEVLPTAGGAEGYLLDADFANNSSACTGPDNTGTHGTNPGANADYDADESTSGANTYSGGTITNIFQPLANCSGTPPATSNGANVTLMGKATISGATPAGTDYTDTWSIVAAGEF